MMGAGLALQKAIHAALVGDAALAGLVGTRIHDAPPRDVVFPYVTFGALDARDWSTGTEGGAELALTLHAWSRHGGKSEVLAVLAAMTAVLDDAGPSLDGHALVSLRVTESEARREGDGITWRGTLRLRALTEPA